MGDKLITHKELKLVITGNLVMMSAIPSDYSLFRIVVMALSVIELAWLVKEKVRR